MGPGGFFPTNPDLADILGRTDFDFEKFYFFPPTQKMGPDGPKWGQEDFFLLIQTLLTFWAERILTLRMFIFLVFWAPNLGPAWAQLGPSLGPAGIK